MEFYLAGVVIMSAVVIFGASCPTECYCEYDLAGLYVYCHSRNLGSIPTNLPSTTFGLYLNHNGLTVLNPQVIRSMSNLRFITLQFNKIKTIEENSFVNLTNLNDLWLHDNKIKTIEENSFVNLTNLTLLYLNNNEISVIKENAFVNLPRLQELYLHNNNITVLDPTMTRSMPSLYRLWLHDNKIKTIEESSFVNLTNLTELYLNNNEISVIKENAFINLPRLQELILDNNVISVIKENAFVNLPGLRDLNLTSNPLICNCSVLPFWAWLTKRPSLGTSAICSDGTNVINITSSALDKCNDTVNGQWSNWGSWAACIMICGNGPQYRNRYCNNPTPANGGSDCQGLNYESVSCNNGACPVNGQWSNWGSWTACNVTWGNGTQNRNRSCNNPTPANEGSDCQGLNYETVSCKSGACPESTCQCYNGGICTVGSDGQSLCTCVGKWKGEKCLASQCLSYDCGKDSCYVEPVNGSAKCFPQSGFSPNTTTELSTQTTTSSPPPTSLPCTGVENRTNKVLGESCGQHGVDGICIVAFSACMQSSSDTGWKCRCAQGYAQKSTSCVPRPNVLFSSQEPYKWIVPTSKTSNVTLNLTAVDGFQTSNPTASLTGEGASYFTVTVSLTNVILSVTRNPDKSNYSLVLTASVTIDDIVIREFKEIIISVSQSLITKDIILLDGTPKGSVVGELCKFCSTGSDLCSISSTYIPIMINEEGIIETTNLINLNVIQNIQTVAYSTIIQVTKRTGLIANLTIFVVRTRYTTTLPEDSTLQTQVGRMNLVQSFRILSNETIMADGDSIKLTRQLNYEAEPYFEKIFTLHVNGATSHEFDILLTIKVQDVNNNPPSFSASTYTFKAVKSTYKDIVVGVTTAIDADTNSQLRYVISPNNILSIDNYGVIKIAEPYSETNYTATVSVSDGFFTTNTSISFEFYQNINVNLNRTFSASVPENVQGQNITNVSDNNYTNYQFTDQSAKNDFVIDQISGTIRNVRAFDRENEQERQFKYTITATKKNEASCSLVIIGDVTIRVTDVNDEPPVFVNIPYTASVQEEHAGNQLMMNFPISTTDKDLNSSVSYSISSPSSFTIGSQTGVITTPSIDRETTASVIVKIIASDTVNSATASVTVIILDINDNHPYFTGIPYTYSIPEDNRIGNTVGIVTANDSDTGKNAEITFDIISNGGFFRINQTTGRITVARQLDRETIETHLVAVYARDNGDQILSSSTTVTITLIDVNDNPPLFKSEGRITVTFDEGESCLSPNVTVVATDADKSNTPNSQIKYSIISGGENFNLGELTGILTCKQMLDYEMNSTFILLIKAEDNGANKLSSNQTVVINVNDINDNKPEFISHNAEIVIRYFTNTSRVIEKYDVIDKDAGENGRLTLTLSGDAESFLAIDNSGLLRIKAQSNRPNGIYSLTITAKDNGLPQLSSNLTVNVRVTKDTSPAVSFNVQEINMNLTENTVETTVIGNISDYVHMEQSNIRLLYLIINADVDNKFNLSSNGVIRSNELLDREQKNIYEFVVRAENIDNSAQSDLALVRVHILDVNDNPPVFKAESYFYTIAENETVQTTVNPKTTKIVATDVDIGENAIIHFMILDEGGCKAQFTLKDAGAVNAKSIVLDKTIDYEEHKLCRLILKAYNPNNVVMSSTLNVDINILDYNDNPPEFLDKTGNSYMVSIPEDTTINTEIPAIGLLRDMDSRENSDIVLSAAEFGCIFNITNFNNTINLRLKSGISLDYESKNTSLKCIIMAQDKGIPVLSATATLSIAITDVNDNAPIVSNPSINTNVSRFAEINANINNSKIQATDADSGENGRLTYSIQASEYSSKFKIDPNLAILSVNAPLTSVQADKITIRVTVSDNGFPRLVSFVTVTIKITDDNPKPYFKQNFAVSIAEHSKTTNGNIIKVQAYDITDGKEAICDCIYRLDTKREDIIIEAGTGQIKFKNSDGSFDREKELNGPVDVVLYVVVIAEDKDIPPKSSSVTVSINITDINDQAPYFDDPEYTFKVYQLAPSGTLIGKMNAVDKDKDPETFYSIKITQGDFNSSVSINNLTGEITKIGDMSFNKTTNLEMKGRVYAKDGKDDTKAAVSCLITIIIEYDDKNKHTPVFENALYECDLTWDAEAGFVFKQLNATDEDTGDAGVVSYSIESGNSRGFFKIGKYDGRLTLLYKLDSSIGILNVIKLSLVVMAKDNGVIPKLSNTTVIITISGQNPGLCIQGSAHQKQVTSLEGERNKWSYALYALVAAWCVTMILMFISVYKWRTSSPVPSSSPFETNKHKYFSNETAYNDLDRRQTVEYSQSNQAFEPPDPYNKITEERSASNEPAPDYPVRDWETPQTRVLPHSTFT